MLKSRPSYPRLLCLLAFACQPLHDLDEVARGSREPLDTSETTARTTGEGLESSPSTVTSSGDGETSRAIPGHPSTEVYTGGAKPSDSMDDSAVSAPSSDAALTSASRDNGVETTSTSGPTTNTEDANTASSADDSSGEFIDTSTDETVSDETSAAASCERNCALGTSCSAINNCASLRCDGTCQPTQLRVESDGIDAISTSIKIHFELYADPAVPVAWSDLAVLYFVTVEKRDDFVLHFAEGGGTALPMQVTLNDWMVVWTTDAAGNVPSTVTPIDVQFRSDPWLPDEPESNTNSNDYSYLPKLGVNDNIVLCRNIDGKWTHIQGIPPASVSDPCSLVGDCNAVLSCDPL